VSVKHLNQRQLADRWDVSEATLERWRSEGIGPVFLKLQGRVLYRLEDVEVLRVRQPAQEHVRARRRGGCGMSHLTPDQVLVTPAGELAELSSESLFQLKNDAADLLAAAKAIVEHVDRALDLRYAQRAHQLRLAAGKDTGVVHFDDGQVRITADLPKKVEWDQAKLNDITRRIAANGEDPTEYVEISYRISETKFNAWPETLKSAFAPARTLKTGKPGFRLALIQE
jgi:hypothetical protein